VQGIGAVERWLPRSVQDADAVEEDIGGREKREPGVLMVVVVPPDEILEPSACMKDAGKVTG
jgi:hypothetical protein